MRRSTRLAGKATKTVVDDGEDDEVVEKKKRTKSKVVEDEESFGKDAHDDEEEEEADVVVSEFSDEPKSKKGKKKQGKKKKKKKAEHEEEDDGAEEKPKKSLDSFPSNKFISKEQYREIDENKEKFAKYTIDELKAILRKNEQKLKGTKPELVDRVAENCVLGSIPLCPSCGGGKPDFDLGSLSYFCKGYFDDTDYQRCNKRFNFSQIHRLPLNESFFLLH